MFCGRYAPSPTGRLHLGNIRTALLAWLQARLAGGRFILRIDDLDQTRCRPHAVEQIIADLKWLGIDWDEGPDIGGDHSPYLQSLRTKEYSRYFRRLVELEKVFPCYCSRRDIRQAQSAPNSGVPMPAYSGTCRPRNATGSADRQNTESPVRSWRFLTSGIIVECRDELLGHKTQCLESEVGDFVVKRHNNLFAYQLATVVDDGLMDVTDVVRGADLISSMPRQAVLFDLLGFSRPRFWHVPLMNDRHGSRMAKRDEAASIDAWRSQNKSPAKLIGMLAHSVHLIDLCQPMSCHELLGELTLEKFGNYIQ